MELDKRIKSIDSIRSFNTNNDDCLGKFGYFTNYVTNFDDLNGIRKGICVFKDGSRFPFYADSIESQKFQFFIPENELLPKEKKYRPFTMEEFNDLVEFGEFVSYRQKDKAHTYCVMYVGNQYTSETEDNPQEDMVGLGPYYHSFEELLNDYEWLPADQDKWVPFGVEVEE